MHQYLAILSATALVQKSYYYTILVHIKILGQMLKSLNINF